MCGIIGIIGKRPVAGDLVDALKRLEYRGYDSAGIATIHNGQLGRRRAKGKLRNLEMELMADPLAGHVGIGHTRWATHGEPTVSNAHPHSAARVSVVHNGIIENFRELREELEKEGAVFLSETDTEVIAHLVDRELDRGCNPVEAVSQVLGRLEGAFALGIIFKGEEDLLIGARRGSPLAIGHGDGEVFLGSDAIALASFTDDITYLEDGDWVILTRDTIDIRDADGKPAERKKQKSSVGAQHADKGNYRHYMIKEIHEQPDVITSTLAHYIDFVEGTVSFDAFPFDFASLPRLTISACGTAYYAGLVAKYWFEQYARLPVDIDVASEFRYREAPMEENGLALVISQSGETADTLAALRYCKAQKQHMACIVNVSESTIARESDLVLPTFAGPEIGVASTKAFTCQLAVLATLAIAAGKARGHIDKALEQELVQALVKLPRQIQSALENEQPYETMSQFLSKASDVLYLGRGISYPVALEGALKLKEISYIHAEGYAAGELKHGPIALIHEKVPVIIVAPHDDLFDKTISNMQEVAARKGRVIMISNAPQSSAGCELEGYFQMPQCHPFTSPVLYAIPVQLLSYHTAVFMGTDVDQPRNLAKSVTVE